MNPIVELSSGRIMGIDRDGISVFKSIPYGAPVDGAMRFLPPKKVAPWEGVLDCTENGVSAMQFGTAGGLLPRAFTGGHPERFGVVEGNADSSDKETSSPVTRSENCLVAGVLTPGLDDKKRPVLVYIHGGGFSCGAGYLATGADDFAKEQDIVVCYLHHRLNVFGYLYLGAFDKKYESSGMAGMIDLVLGLEWVRDNIARFGGDPEKVTILGESGGAMKVNTLLNMPVTKDLFRYGVVESGSNVVGVDNRAEATEAARYVLNALGVGENELERLADFSGDEILNAAEPILRAFRPVPDDIYLKIRKHPMFAFEDCAIERRVLVSSSEDELASFMTPEERATDRTDENLIPLLTEALNRGAFGVKDSKTYTEEMTAKIVERFKEITGNTDPEQLYWNILSSRSTLGGGAYRQAVERASIGGAPVFASYNALDVPDQNDERKSFAWHVSDLPLQLRIVGYDFCEPVSRIQSDTLAAFIRTGDPSTDYFKWPAFTITSEQIVRFDLETKVVKDYRKELLKAFEEA